MSPRVWVAEPHEAETVARLLVGFRNHLGVDWPSDNAFLAGVERLIEDRGARFLLDRDVVTVGRHPDSDIFLDDITVSRRHAEFRRDANRFWVHDVGSLNGTYVNGERAEDQLLDTGDEVQIGKYRLTFLEQ